MKIAFAADVHLANHKRWGGALESGINRRCREALNVLAMARRHAEERDCESLYILGDLFDTAKPEPQLIDAVQRIFDDGFNCCVLVGNHDQVSDEPGDHALGPLQGFGRMRVIEQANADNFNNEWAVTCVPFQSGNAREYLPAAMAAIVLKRETAREAKMSFRILALHMGIIDKDTPPWLRDSKNAIEVEVLDELAQRHGFDAVFAGDWHQHKAWRLTPQSPIIAQVGALVPHSFSDAGLEGYGSLLIWDSENKSRRGQRTVERIEIPGPRFITTRLKDWVVMAQGECQHYVRVIAGVDEMKEAQSFAQQQVEAGNITAFEVVPDDTEARAATRSATNAARSADTLAEALAGYVTAMKLDKGTDRDAVLERCRGFLK